MWLVTGGVNCQRGNAARGSDMRNSGIIGDDEVRLAYSSNCLQPTGASGKIDDRAYILVLRRNPVEQIALRRRSDKDDRATGLVEQQSSEPGVIVEAPIPKARVANGCDDYAFRRRWQNI